MIHINPKLEEYIFEKLQGIYRINPEAVAFNLENDDETNRCYLGTYFPRSFVEAYNIYKGLFNNDKIWNNINDRKNIKIFILGSGTGGDLMGLLQALNERFSNKMIEIYSIDGNQIALEYQKMMIRDLYGLMTPNNNDITLYTECITISSVDNIKEIMKEYDISKNINIMQSFKFANELYMRNQKSIYYELVEIAELVLETDGMFIFEDVTNKSADGKYYNVAMTQQVREYFRKSKKSRLKYLLPLGCAKWYKHCPTRNCFTQLEYRVDHRAKTNDISKIAFKLVVADNLGEILRKSIGDEICYKIANRIYCSNTSYHYDCSTPPKTPCKDAFEL